jgi:ABC-type multidrug transport system fused ATPase/permease subunit
MLLNFENNFWGYFKFYYSVIGYRIFISILLSVMVSFLDGIGLAMLIPMLQAVEGNPNESKDAMGQLSFVISMLEKIGFTLTLNSVLLVIILLFSLKGLTKFFEQYYQVKTVHFFMKKIRYTLVSNLNSLTYEGFLTLDAGTIQNTFIGEVQRMSQAVKGYLRWTQALLMLITYVVLAVMANYQFAILVALAAGLSNLLYRKIYTSVKKLSNDISIKGNDFNAFMIEAIHNFKYLRSTNYLNNFSSKLKKVIDNTEILNKKTGFYNSIALGIREPMILLIVVFVIYLHVNLLNGSLSSIILSLLLLYRGLNFLIVIQNEWQLFIQNIGALNSVTSISNKMNRMKEVKGEREFIVLTNKIELKGLVFEYGNSKILKDVNVNITKNQTIAFVGGSGSGKTTLANIICGLITPKSGSVLIDGFPLDRYNLENYREKIGYISQESATFNDTIFNNITFWSEPTDENINRFWEAVRLTSLEDFINQQQLKEHTKIGDNGILVSGGQKQRIAIARELFKKPEILIFDEATSALDSETELVIKNNIDKLHGAYTLIIIAHRLSTIKNADIIYLLDRGSITASGTFDSLQEVSEPFKRMVILQGLEFR